MWQNIQKNLFKPFIRRVGTVFATWMIAEGIDPTLAGQIEMGVIAFGLLASDYFLSWHDRKDSK